MRRKQFLIWSGILGLVLGGLGTTLVCLLYHEPSFYHHAAIAPAQDRKAVANNFLLRFPILLEYFQESYTPSKKVRVDGWAWYAKEEEINSYFEDGFQMWGDAELLRKWGVSQPRMVIEQDKIRLAFRYGTMPWSTIISLEFKMWVVPREINVVAVEILNRRAGGLPISAQFILDQITEIARKSNIEVNWYRHEGNPVALFHFQGNQMRPTAQLRRIELRPGMITIGGKPVESGPIADLDPPPLKKLDPAREHQQTCLNPAVVEHRTIYPPEDVSEEP